MTTWAVVTLFVMAVPGWLIGRTRSRRNERLFVAVAAPLVAAFLVVQEPGFRQVVAGAAAGLVIGNLVGWGTALSRRRQARRVA